MSRPSQLAGLLVLAILIALPFGLKSYGIYVLTLWLVYSVAAMGLNLTLGYAGQVSLAQAAFLGIGAYITALLLKAGVPFFAAFGLSGLACFLVGLLLGYPALRVQHHFLAFVTLAFNGLVWLVLRNEEWLTGGTYGLMGFPRPVVLGLDTSDPLTFYLFTLAISLALAVVLWWIVRSPWGRAFQALRENPVRANSLGVDIRAMTLLAFAVGSAYGGMAGALFAPLVEFIDPMSFTFTTSLMILLMVIVGGSGHFLGPILGALLVVLLPEWLRFTEGLYLILYAILVIVLMVFCPAGLLGLYHRAVRVVRSRVLDRRELTGRAS